MTKNKIDAKLEQCRAEGRKALITFITSGDGGYDVTEQAVLEMEKNGADLIELGVPFSDPIAEGPVIQCASERSLKNGTTLAGIFEMVRRLRKKTNVPLLLMMYLNTISGSEPTAFSRSARSAELTVSSCRTFPLRKRTRFRAAQMRTMSTTSVW